MHVGKEDGSVSSALVPYHVQNVALCFAGIGQLHTTSHIAQRERQEGFRQALYVTFIQGGGNLQRHKFR